MLYVLCSQDGGPTWEVQMGRRDSRTAHRAAVVAGIPSPFESFDRVRAKFTNVGLDSTDLVALSGMVTTNLLPNLTLFNVGLLIEPSYY